MINSDNVPAQTIQRIEWGRRKWPGDDICGLDTALTRMGEEGASVTPYTLLAARDAETPRVARSVVCVLCCVVAFAVLLVLAYPLFQLEIDMLAERPLSTAGNGSACVFLCAWPGLAWSWPGLAWPGLRWH